MVPRQGMMSPSISLRRVVLPLPELPMIANVSPRLTSRYRSLWTTTPSNAVQMPSAMITGAVMATPLRAQVRESNREHRVDHQYNRQGGDDRSCRTGGQAFRIRPAVEAEVAAN